ncbi:hypothetical protein ACTXT7_007103, partial [Hymenolepis weldensis]
KMAFFDQSKRSDSAPGQCQTHTSRATKNLVEEFGWEVMHLMHHPPYSPVPLLHQPIFNIFSGAYRIM